MVLDHVWQVTRTERDIGITARTEGDLWDLLVSELYDPVPAQVDDGEVVLTPGPIQLNDLLGLELWIAPVPDIDHHSCGSGRVSWSGLASQEMMVARLEDSA